MNQSVITFEDILKPVIWGGTRIAAFKGIECDDSHIGESWEVSPMTGHESIVGNGPLKGKSLCQIVDEFGKEILGEKVFEKSGGRFPLLIKFIDSNDDLSIQVHPDDRLAHERHNSLGKTEMWYSVAPADGAYLYAGFSRRVTPDEFRRQIADHTLMGSLNKFMVKPGDVFYLPAGRVHSIGRGNFVLEIQEASDITYRIYDYGRVGSDGKPRQLHVEESLGAIDFNDVGMASANVQPRRGEFATLHKCEYFNTSLAEIDKPTDLPLATAESFTIVIVTCGSLVLTDAQGSDYSLHQGQSALIPASVATLTASPTTPTVRVVTVTA